jgi:hypothetical protein
LKDSRDRDAKKVVGQAGWVGMEFTKSNTDFFKDSRKVGVLIDIGDIPGSVKDSTTDFGLEGLDACNRLAKPHSSMRYVQVGFSIVSFLVSLLVKSTVDVLCNSLRRSPSTSYAQLRHHQDR